MMKFEKVKLWFSFEHNGCTTVPKLIDNANLTFSQKKHPVILQAKSHVVKLFVHHIHEKYFNCGKAFILSFIRTKFWINGNLSNLTNVVKNVIRQCVVCIQYAVSKKHQLMGELPAKRINVSRPFSNVGVDFAGPITMKCVGHRSKI